MLFRVHKQPTVAQRGQPVAKARKKSLEGKIACAGKAISRSGQIHKSSAKGGDGVRSKAIW